MTARSSWTANNNRHRLRRYVLARDRGICHLCGLTGADTVDHLQPHSLGGSDHPSNLAAAHARCNYSRGDKPIPTPTTSRTY